MPRRRAATVVELAGRFGTRADPSRPGADWDEADRALLDVPGSGHGQPSTSACEHGGDPMSACRRTSGSCAPPGPWSWTLMTRAGNPGAAIPPCTTCGTWETTDAELRIPEFGWEPHPWWPPIPGLPCHLVARRHAPRRSRRGTARITPYWSRHVANSTSTSRGTDRLRRPARPARNGLPEGGVGGPAHHPARDDR